MRIVVIGGHGFLGARAVRALRRADGVDVVVAGRRARGEGDLVVDLSRPETFAALEGADVIVDASSSHAVAPDALAAHCLARGLLLLETSSDRVVIERLLDAHRGGPAEGTLVLGAGIFTGVSNALAAEAARTTPGCTALELGVRSSPLSGAGAGTIDLMVDALGVPTRAIEGGARTERPTVARGPRLPFAEGEAATLHIPFAEPVMLHASTGARDVAMYMAPVPSLLRLAFLALPSFLLGTRAFATLLRAYFTLLRRVLLSSVASRVGLVARARGPRGARVLALTTPDGFDAAGVAIAATALELARRAERPRGTFLVDELVPLHPMLAGMRALRPDLTLDLRATELA